MTRVTDLRSDCGHAAPSQCACSLQRPWSGWRRVSAYVMVRAAPADQHHIGAASDTCPRRKQQLRRCHPGAHRPQRHHPAAGRQGSGSGAPGAQVEKMVKVSAPTNQLHPDRRDLHQGGRGADAVAGRRRLVRRLRQRHRSGGHRGRAWRTSMSGGTTCRRRSANCRVRSPPPSKRQQAADPNSPEGKEEAQLLARLRTRAGQPRRCSSTRSRTRSPRALRRESAGAGTSVVQHATEPTGPSTVGAAARSGHRSVPWSALSGGRDRAGDSTARPAGAAPRRDRRRSR